MARWRKVGAGDSGASAAEYGLLVGLLALAIVAGAAILGFNINTFLNNIASYFAGVKI